MLYVGHRSTEWCPRCGTSLSQHELTQSGVYQEKSDPSLFVRFPLLDRPGESVVDLDDDAVDAAGERRGGRQPRGRLRAARERRVGRSPRAIPDDTFVRARARARSSSACATAGRSTTSARARRSSIASCRGTRSRSTRAPGIVHIATGCGGEDFELGKALGLAGAHAGRRGRAASTTTTAGCTASRRPRPPIRSSATSASAGFLVAAETYVHNYPHCWRCDTPLICRISDDWFIGVDDVREQLLEANASVEWVPGYMGKRMDDWLRNMGDWNISRRRYYGLPLPFYPCSCGHLNVIGSKAELEQRARRRASTSSRSCGGRGSTACRSRARSAASRSSASSRSATSGSTPASSRSRRSAG